MTMEKQPFEHVFPIQNRDFPLPLVMEHLQMVVFPLSC